MPGSGARRARRTLRPASWRRARRRLRHVHPQAPPGARLSASRAGEELDRRRARRVQAGLRVQPFPPARRGRRPRAPAPSPAPAWSAPITRSSISRARPTNDWFVRYRAPTGRRPRRAADSALPSAPPASCGSRQSAGERRRDAFGFAQLGHRQPLTGEGQLLGPARRRHQRRACPARSAAHIAVEGLESNPARRRGAWCTASLPDGAPLRRRPGPARRFAGAAGPFGSPRWGGGADRLAKTHRLAGACRFAGPRRAADPVGLPALIGLSGRAGLPECVACPGVPVCRQVSVFPGASVCRSDDRGPACRGGAEFLAYRHYCPSRAALLA